MTNYSDKTNSVRVDFFKPGGKWYMEEAVMWPSELWASEPEAGSITSSMTLFIKHWSRTLKRQIARTS